MEISLVVPVYNSQDCLPELLKQIEAELTRLGMSYEVILVDDDSTDGSWQVIQREAGVRPAVSGIQMMRNVGQVSATLCGMAYARGGVVVTLDDDLQHPPDQLGILIGALRDEPATDCVFGAFEDKKHSAYRNLGSRFIAWIHRRAFGLPRDIQPSSFRALRRPLVDAILAHPTRAPSLTALIAACTRRIRNVAVRHAERYSGRSNYTLLRQFRLAFDNICSSSTLPLKVVSTLGLLFCAGGIGYALLVLSWYLEHRIKVAGWTTLAILVSFSAGIILLSLGVFGEYLSRILREVRGAPRHVERTRIGPAAERGAADEGRG